jgi:phosphoribosylanthranilate isomerase
MVGVFQNAPVAEANAIAVSLGLDFVQLHGEEDADYVLQVAAPVIKAIRLAGEPVAEILARMRAYDVRYFLLDRAVQGQGERIDFEVARTLAREFPVFVAGGLNLLNVTEAVHVTSPFGVDVAGGIETQGQPDPDLVRAFIERAKFDT